MMKVRFSMCVDIYKVPAEKNKIVKQKKMSTKKPRKSILKKKEAEFQNDTEILEKLHKAMQKGFVNVREGSKPATSDAGRMNDINEAIEKGYVRTRRSVYNVIKLKSKSETKQQWRS